MNLHDFLIQHGWKLNKDTGYYYKHNLYENKKAGKALEMVWADWPQDKYSLLAQKIAPVTQQTFYSDDKPPTFF